jgi:hypothetical protein
MREFAMHVTHRPGEVARIAGALGRKGVNIRSIAGMNIGTQGVIRLITDDIEAARSALQEGNIRFEENEVCTVLLENKAGELAEVASKMSNASLNLNAVYVVGLSGDLVELAVIADDPKKAKKVLE